MANNRENAAQREHRLAKERERYARRRAAEIPEAKEVRLKRQRNCRRKQRDQQSKSQRNTILTARRKKF